MRPLSPLRLPADAPPQVARAYLLTHDTRVQRVDRLSDQSLKLMWQAEMQMNGLTSLMGGPESHDELVNYIADMEFPDAARAREIYHGWVMSGKQPALGQE